MHSRPLLDAQIVQCQMELAEEVFLTGFARRGQISSLRFLSEESLFPVNQNAAG